MKTAILDTNSFLRFLLNDIPGQADQISRLFTKAKKKELDIFVPQIVIFEIEFALDKYYRFPKGEVIDKLKTLVSTPYLKIQDSEVFLQAIALYRNKNIDFVDCFLSCNAKLRGSDLVTFDKDLQKLSGL